MCKKRFVFVSFATVFVLSSHAASAQCRTGNLSQYAPGVMEHVVRIRQAGLTAKSLPTVLPPVDGFLAVIDCAEIGNTVVVHAEQKHETFLIADCAGDKSTASWMWRNNVIGEIDGETAKRWQVVGKASPRITLCPHQPGNGIIYQPTGRMGHALSRADKHEVSIFLLPSD